MSLADERARDGARPLIVVELDLDEVTSPTAASNPDGTPCFRTPATSQGFKPLTVGTRTRRFCSASAPRPWEIDALPCISSLRLEPAHLVTGKRGEFGTATVSLADFLDDDRAEDPYFSERDPKPEPGSYFGRLQRRHPWLLGRAVRIGIGFATETYDPANLEWRHYVVRSLKGKGGHLELACISPLQQLELDKRRVPAPVRWRLATGIDGSTTNANLVDGTVEDSDPNTGLLRMDDELCAFTRSDHSLTLTRAQHGTAAVPHEQDASVQPALSWQNAPVWQILRDLLLSAGVDPALIVDADWQAEHARRLALYDLNPQPISEPEPVLQLVAELCEQVGLLLWFDERARSIRLRAIRPISDVVASLTDADLLSDPEDETDAASRVSRCAILYGLRNGIADVDADASYRRRLIGPAYGEESWAHATPAQKLLRSRWLNANQDAIAARSATTIPLALRDGRRELRVRVGKHHGHIDLGDVIELTSTALPDAAGAATAQRYLVTSRADLPDLSSLELRLEPFDLAGRFAHVMSNGYSMTYANANENERDPGWFLSTNDGRLPNGDPGYGLA